MRALFTLLVVAGIASASASAQSLSGNPLPAAHYPEARVVQRGLLRIGFEPEYISFDDVYDAAGMRRPLGWTLSSDSAGSDIFPTAAPAETGARILSGIADYRLSIGKMLTVRQADVRRFPFTIEVGIGKHLSLTAAVPLVTTRTQITFSLDTTAVNAGLNPAFTTGGTNAIASLIQAYNAQADAVDAQIAGGAYGCPGSAQCIQAQDVVNRTRAATQALSMMTGVAADGSLSEAAPPFVPRASSAAGLAIQAELNQLASDLAALGATPAVSGLSLPAAATDTGAIQALLAGPEAGFDATRLGFLKYRQKLGDMELGLRWGLADRSSLRAVLGAGVRLPTGKREDPNYFVDIGAGDHQFDAIGSFEAVWTPGKVVALAIQGDYTLQFPDRLTQRVTPPDQPLNVAASSAAVNRNLGDVLHLSAYPSVRLSEAFTAYGAVHYFHKGADTYTRVDGDPVFITVPASWYYPASALGALSKFEQVSFGAGIHYDAQGVQGQYLPIQAGIDYRAAFRGTGGLTPKDVRLSFYIRLYYRLFGRR